MQASNRLARLGHHLQAPSLDSQLTPEQTANPEIKNELVKTRYKPHHEITTTRGEVSWFGWRALYIGQAALVGDRFGLGGNRVLVKGPCSLFMFFQSFELLTPFFANPNQFLRVQFLTGERKTIQGPCSMFLDPSLHASIQIHSAVGLNSGQAIVVYKRQGDASGAPPPPSDQNVITSSVSRKIIHGPAQYVPEADEWMHKFFWHIPDQANPTYAHRQLLKFEKLRTIPDQIYYDVTGCRTSDDAVITLRTLVFFRLIDIEAMLSGSVDPVADLINTLTADVLEFTASRTFEQFKVDSEQLNKLETYPQVKQRLTSIGYNVEKIVYRGYVASTKLQDMHNNAIEARTLLILGTETEKQKQDLEDMKLRRMQERVALTQDQERKTAAHKAELENKETTHKLALGQQEHAEALRRSQEDDKLEKQRLEASLDATRAKNQVALEHAKGQLGLEAAYLQGLSDKGVDLTKLMVAKYAKPDKLINIGGADVKAPQMHLHEGLLSGVASL